MIKKNNSGFTLIELLLVLSVISIIILISPPIKRFNLENITHEQFISVFESDLLFAQNLSTTTEDYVRIRFSRDNYRLMNGEKTVFRRYYPEGLQVNTRSNNIIVFKTTGSVVNRKAIRITTNNAVYEAFFPLGKGRVNVVEI